MIKKILTLLTVIVLVGGIVFTGIWFFPRDNDTGQPMPEQEPLTVAELMQDLRPISFMNVGMRNPSEMLTRNLYDNEGRRLFRLSNTGLLVTEDARIAYSPEQNGGQSTGTTVNIYGGSDTVSPELVSGANRNLRRMINSHGTGYWLHNGQNVIRTVHISDTLHVVDYRREDGTTMEIFVTYENVTQRVEVPRINPLSNIVFGPRIQTITRTRFANVLGHEIKPSRIGHVREPSRWQIIRDTTLVMAGVGGNRIGDLITRAHVWSIIDSYTLGELLEEIQFATEHPWAHLYEDFWDTQAQSMRYREVLTQDGNRIFVNPRTMQLYDHVFPLFHYRTGFPIVFHNHDIVTAVDGLQQRIENGVLRDSMSTMPILQEGNTVRFTQTTWNGRTFYLVEMNKGTDSNEDWRLPNGDSADDIRDDFYDWDDVDRFPDVVIPHPADGLLGRILDWLADALDGVGTFLRVLMIIGIVIAGIFILGIVALLLFLAFLPIMIVIKKSKGG